MANWLSHGPHMAALPVVFDALRINTLELNIRLIRCQGFPAKQRCPANTSCEQLYEEAGLVSLSLFSTWFQFKLNTNKGMAAALLPHVSYLYYDQAGCSWHVADCSIFSRVTSIKLSWLSFCGLRLRDLVNIMSHHIFSKALCLWIHAYCFSRQVLILKEQSLFYDYEVNNVFRANKA